MAKIPFDIKFRPQIESGEYFVETRDGRPVRIICWDRSPSVGDDIDFTLCVLIKQKIGESIYYYNHSGESRLGLERYDLFIITPDPELSEFEEATLKAFDKMCAGEKHLTPRTNHIQEAAAELLALARKDLNPAEWSEEDEKDIQEASEYLRDYANNCVQGKNSKLYLHSLADRIESLRHQPHWKPSEEQMEVDFEKEIDLESLARKKANETYPPMYECPDDNYKQRSGFCRGFKIGYNLGLNAGKEDEK